MPRWDADAPPADRLGLVAAEDASDGAGAAERNDDVRMSEHADIMAAEIADYQAKIAALNARLRPVIVAKSAHIVRAMPQNATTPGASDTEAAQRRRLRALRRMCTDWMVDAAEAAGVSEHSWGRMERGPTGIDIVALARFCRAYQVPSEYVTTGEFAGLSREQIDRLVALEAEEAAIAAGGRTAGPRRRRRGGRSRQKDTPGTATDA